MAVKALGSEFKSFYNNNPTLWDGWYVDDFYVVIKHDGKVIDDMDAAYRKYGDMLERLPDDAEVSIESGFLCWQGDSRTQPADGGGDLDDAFLAWKKKQSVTPWTVSFDVSKDMPPQQQARLKALLETLGATVKGPPDSLAPVTSAEKMVIEELASSFLSPASQESASNPSRPAGPR